MNAMRTVVEPIDLRVEVRLPRLQPVQVTESDRWGSTACFTMGRTLDVSPLGVCVELGLKIPDDTEVGLTVALREEVAALRGVVRWVRPASIKRRWAHGIELTLRSLETDDYWRFRRFVNEARREAAEQV